MAKLSEKILQALGWNTGLHLNGEQVRDELYAFYQRKYPEDPNWMDPEFHCFKDEPIEIRMCIVLDTLEYNISNGGWSQVLWNCFGTWRTLLADASQAYGLLNAQAQITALGTLGSLLDQDEAECLEWLQKGGQETGTEELSAFAEFTSRSYGALGNDWEDLFFGDSGVYDKRIQWLEKHQFSILRQIRA